MRRDELCVGPHACHESDEIRDEQGFLMKRQRCDECPLTKLDDALVAHPVLTRAYDLDFALTAGFDLKLSDVDCEEFRALKVLRIERDKWQAQQIKNQRSSQ